MQAQHFSAASAEIQDEKFAYPNSVSWLMLCSSKQFQNIPRRKYLIRGTKVKIPSNGTVRQQHIWGALLTQGYLMHAVCGDMDKMIQRCLYDLLTDKIWMRRL